MSVAIRILNGKSNITSLPWKIVNIKENLTIQKFFEYLVNQYRMKEELEKVSGSKSEKEAEFEIDLECIISDVVNKFNISFFTFYIKDDNNPKPSNAFEILKSAAKEYTLPIFNFSPQNSKNLIKDDKLKLDILSCQAHTQLMAFSCEYEHDTTKALEILGRWILNVAETTTQETSQKPQEFRLDSQKYKVNTEPERFNFNFQTIVPNKRLRLSGTNNPLYQQNFSGSYHDDTPDDARQQILRSVSLLSPSQQNFKD